MRLSLDPGEFSTGLDLLLLGSIGLVIGNFIISVRGVPTDSVTSHSGITLLQAAVAIPEAVGILVAGAGLIAMVGGPVFYWIIWPLQHACSNFQGDR